MRRLGLFEISSRSGVRMRPHCPYHILKPKSSSDYLCNVRLRVSRGYDKKRPCKMVNSLVQALHNCLVLYKTEITVLYFYTSTSILGFWSTSFGTRFHITLFFFFTMDSTPSMYRLDNQLIAM